MTAIHRERLTGILVGLAGVGAVVSAWLVVSEVFREPTCPPLFGIPACYLVLAGYTAATIGAWYAGRRAGHATLLVGAVSVTLIGIYFSVGQIRGTADCPTFEGLPMC